MGLRQPPPPRPAGAIAAAVATAAADAAAAAISAARPDSLAEPFDPATMRRAPLRRGPNNHATEASQLRHRDFDADASPTAVHSGHSEKKLSILASSGTCFVVRG